MTLYDYRTRGIGIQFNFNPKINKADFIRLRDIVRPMAVERGARWKEEIDWANSGYAPYDHYLAVLMYYVNYGKQYNKILEISTHGKDIVENLIAVFIELELINFYAGGYDLVPEVDGVDGQLTRIDYKSRIQSLVSTDSIAYLKHIPILAPNNVKFINVTPLDEVKIDDDGFKHTIEHKKELIVVNDGEEVRFIKRWNKFALKFNVEIEIGPKDEVKTTSLLHGITGMIPLNPCVKRQMRQPRLNYSSEYLKRVKSGGRLYNVGVFRYQGIESKLRPKILIDKEKTIELDFGCMHAVMAYAMNGIQYNEDAYRIFDDLEYLTEDDLTILRNVMKQPVLSTLSSKSKPQYREYLKYTIEENWAAFCLIKEYRNMKTKKIVTAIIKRLEEKHKDIRHLMYKSLWKDLQYHDSEIMMKIMDKCMSHSENILALGVHDSAIVKTKYETILAEIMHECYKEQSKLFSSDGAEYDIKITIDLPEGGNREV